MRVNIKECVEKAWLAFLIDHAWILLSPLSIRCAGVVRIFFFYWRWSATAVVGHIQTTNRLGGLIGPLERMIICTYDSRKSQGHIPLASTIGHGNRQRVNAESMPLASSASSRHFLKGLLYKQRPWIGANANAAIAHWPSTVRRVHNEAAPKLQAAHASAYKPVKYTNKASVKPSCPKRNLRNKAMQLKLDEMPPTGVGREEPYSTNGSSQAATCLPKPKSKQPKRTKNHKIDPSRLVQDTQEPNPPRAQT